MKAKRKAIPGLSPRAQRVWDELDEKTKKDIQKANPFKINRDRAIRELVKGRGLRGAVIGEISGICTSSIYRIVKQEDYLPEYGRKEIKNLVRSFQAFINALAVVLADRYRKDRKEKNEI